MTRTLPTPSELALTAFELDDLQPRAFLDLHHWLHNFISTAFNHDYFTHHLRLHQELRNSPTSPLQRHCTLAHRESLYELLRRDAAFHLVRSKMSMFRRQTDVSSSEADSEDESSSASGSEYESDSEEDDEVIASPAAQEHAAQSLTQSLTQSQILAQTRPQRQVDDDDTANDEDEYGGDSHSNHSQRSYVSSSSSQYTTTASDVVFGERSTGTTAGDDAFASTAAGVGGGGAATEAHKDMMLAALLEHYYQSRALDLFTATTNPPGMAAGQEYTRSSPEVLQLGRQLLDNAIATLPSGILAGAAAASGEQQGRMREQYLRGLDQLALPGAAGGMLSPEEGDSVGSVAGEGGRRGEIHGGGGGRRRRMGSITSLHQIHPDLRADAVFPRPTGKAGGMDLVLPGGYGRGNNHNRLENVGGLPVAMGGLGGFPLAGLAGSMMPHLPHPGNDLALALRQQRPQARSHYKTLFQEMNFLGKGGFGSVFKCENHLDGKMYAIKKIPLSPRLSKCFGGGVGGIGGGVGGKGHGELEKALREVKALATFEHCNIVRYYATWIEEPTGPGLDGVDGGAGMLYPNAPHIPMLPHAGQLQQQQPRRAMKLLEHNPVSSLGGSEPSFSDDARPRTVTSDSRGGIEFGFDSSPSNAFSNNNNNNSDDIQFGTNPNAGDTSPLWSERLSTNRVQELSTSSEDQTDSNIFTDGNGEPASLKQPPEGVLVNDPNVHVLHIQMSLHPMTLSQYLSTQREVRHCFHLMPSLRLLLGILSGLQYIHSKGLVHRDIKPGNIFLSLADAEFLQSSESVYHNNSSNGFCNVGDCIICHPGERVGERWLNPRIGDFGLVTQLAREGYKNPEAFEQRLHEEAPTHVSSDKDEQTVGTLYYRPPKWPPTEQNSQSGSSSENWNGNGKGKEKEPVQDLALQEQPPPPPTMKKRAAIDEKIDIFALGVVLVEMMSCCPTHMQRVDLLKDLQEGHIPEDVRKCAEQSFSQSSERGDTDGVQHEGENTEPDMAEEVVALVSGMVEIDPEKRWDGKKVRMAIERLLHDARNQRKSQTSEA